MTRPPNFVQEIRGILIDEALKAFAKHTPANILWSLTRIGKYQQALGYAELTEGKSKIEAHVLIAEALVQIGEADIANGIFKQVLREIFENNDITGNTHYFGRVITDLYKTYDEEPGYLLKVAKSVKDPRYKTKILNNIAYTLPNQGNWIKRLG